MILRHLPQHVHAHAHTPHVHHTERVPTTQVLLVLLCPLCVVTYAYAAFGSKWRHYLRYRSSHSKRSCRVRMPPW